MPQSTREFVKFILYKKVYISRSVLKALKMVKFKTVLKCVWGELIRRTS